MVAVQALHLTLKFAPEDTVYVVCLVNLSSFDLEIFLETVHQQPEEFMRVFLPAELEPPEDLLHAAYNVQWLNHLLRVQETFFHMLLEQAH